MKRILPLTVIFILGSCAMASAAGLKTGDLIFQDLDCPVLCDAIETVTLEQHGAMGPRLSHVGILIIEDDNTYVLEAYDGVTMTPYAKFISRKQNSSPTARRMGLSPRQGENLKKKASPFIGRPYDEDFVIGNDSYYCSELVYEVYAEILGDKSPFKISPMYYGKTGSDVRGTWDEYFSKKNRSTPEGRPGINPLDILISLEQRSNR